VEKGKEGREKDGGQTIGWKKRRNDEIKGCERRENLHEERR